MLRIKILPLIKEWKNRPLDALYTIIFMDIIHFKVRYEGRVQSKATYVVLGVTLEGFKDVLGIWIGGVRIFEVWVNGAK